MLRNIFPQKLGTEKDHSSIGRGLFSVVVVLSALAMGAYKVEVDSGWRSWAIMIGLELLRAGLVLSNIGIRRIDKVQSYVVLSLSLIMTIGIGFMIHALVPTLSIAKGHEDAAWYLLQTVNAGLLFGEWSMGVLIAGRSLNWSEFISYLKGPMKDAFDWSTADKDIRKILPQIADIIKNLRNRLEWLYGLLELEEDAKDKDIKAKIEELIMAKEDQEKLARWIAIGKATADRRLSVGGNRYEIHCSGTSESKGICPPFEMQKSQSQAGCPHCGKTHYRDPQKVKASLNGQLS